MMRVNRALIGFLAMAMMSAAAFGAGFALYEGSSKGNVVGGIGSSGDASAMFFNPAAITVLEGSHLQLGATFIIPFADLDMNDGVYDPFTVQSGGLDDQLFTPPHIFYTRQINEKLFVGAAVYSRFGLGTKYEPDWAGRYSNVDTQIASVTFNPNVAYKVNDKVSIAAGVRFMHFDASVKTAVDASPLVFEPVNDTRTTRYDAVQTLEDTTDGFGFNLALFVQPNDKFSFGLSWYSEIEQDLDSGVVTFERPAAQVPSTWFVDTNASADPIDLPEMIMLGAGFQVTDKLHIDVSAIQTQWSSIEELVFNYDNPIILEPSLGISIDRVVRDLSWEDSLRWQIGFSYNYSESIDLMFGATFDESPIPDETISYLLPTSNRQLMNFGVRYRMDVWTLDFAYNYLVMENRDIVYSDAVTTATRQLTEGVLVTRIHDAGAHLVAFTLSRKL